MNDKAKLQYEIQLPKGEAISVYRTTGGQLFGIDSSYFENEDDGKRLYQDPIDGERWGLIEGECQFLTARSIEPVMTYYLLGSDNVIRFFEENSLEDFIKEMSSEIEGWEVFKFVEGGTFSVEFGRRTNMYGNCHTITKEQFNQLNNL